MNCKFLTLQISAVYNFVQYIFRFIELSLKNNGCLDIAAGVPKTPEWLTCRPRCPEGFSRLGAARLIHLDRFSAF